MTAWVKTSLLMRVSETVTYRGRQAYHETLARVKTKYCFFLVQFLNSALLSVSLKQFV
jgi:hypothetical protein